MAAVAKSLRHWRDGHIRGGLGFRVYRTSWTGSERGGEGPGGHGATANGSPLANACPANMYKQTEYVEAAAVAAARSCRPMSFVFNLEAAGSASGIWAGSPLSALSPKARVTATARVYSPFPTPGFPFAAASLNATDGSGTRTLATGQSGESDPVWPEEKSKSGTKNVGSRIRALLSDLEAVPVAALGLGLAGAIPFVGLTPGVASILPLPEALLSIHIDAQAAYGAVILTFLGGPHWGLAMTDYGGSPTSSFSRQTIRTIRYTWSVVPSLVAWPALLLSPVPKLALLITSFAVVLGVDATFAKMGLIPPWYMPLRILLSGIAILSLTSSLIVSAAAKVIIQ